MMKTITSGEEAYLRNGLVPENFTQEYLIVVLFPQQEPAQACAVEVPQPVVSDGDGKVLIIISAASACLT